MSTAFSALWADSPDFSKYIDPVLTERVQPWSRIDAGFSFRELDQHKYYERYRTLYVSGEYAFTDWFSMYARIPYTEKTLTDTERIKYIDHIATGFRFAFGWESFKFTTGLNIDFSRGHDRAGDVPKDLGYLEPYLGFYFFIGPVFGQATLLYNTQTNPRFIEDYGQEFDRTIIFQGLLGFRISGLRIQAEMEYRDRYDPDTRIFKTLLAGPSAGFDFSDSMSIAAGALFAVQKEREEDVIFQTRFTYRFN